MKIAILTQPLITNYGGLLQAFALQYVLRKMGHEAITVDRRNPPKVNYTLPYKTFSFGKRLMQYHLLKNQNIGTLWDNHITESIYDELSKNIRPFVKKHIITTIPITSNAQFTELTQMGFDAYIVGSDQCWRKDYSPKLTAYFLDFADGCLWTKRVAYAVSLGVDHWEIPEGLTKKCRKLAKLFDAISVREDSAIELCKQHLDIDAVHTLDPTLLLNDTVYEEIIRDAGIDTSTKDEKLLTTYILDDSSQKQSIVNRVATELSLTHKSTMPCKQFRKVGKEELEACIFASVEEWLANIRKAKFIVTDSFHGTVFAIIFNKPFIAIGNHDRGLTRFTSLLNSLGLADRLILSANELTTELINRPIDYQLVNELRNELKGRSIHFLSQSLA